MIVAILDREPAALSSHLNDVPTHLEEVIKRLLAKDVSSRYQNAADLLTDLKRIKTRIDSGAENPLMPTISDTRTSLAEASTAELRRPPMPQDPFATSIGQAARTDENSAVTHHGAGTLSARGRRHWLFGSWG
jgi:serine/threonine protein kinase